MALPIMALVAGVSSLMKAEEAKNQRRNASSLLGNNPYPNQPISREFLANQRMAQDMANQGLPAQQYQQGVQNIARQQNAALRAAADRRSSLGAVAQAQQMGNDALLSLDVASANAANQNRQNLFGVNNTLGAARERQFNWNQKNKYEQDYNYGMSLMGASNQNRLGAWDDGLSGVLSLLSGMGQNGQTNSVATALSNKPQGNIYGSGASPNWNQF